MAVGTELGVLQHGGTCCRLSDSRSLGGGVSVVGKATSTLSYFPLRFRRRFATKREKRSNLSFPSLVRNQSKSNTCYVAMTLPPFATRNKDFEDIFNRHCRYSMVHRALPALLLQSGIANHLHCLRLFHNARATGRDDVCEGWTDCL